MSKYQFHRLNGETFQQLVQSLLERKRRNYGELIQFKSTGADGAREATWVQQTNHPDYVRPTNCATDVPKSWVFQVKYHDLGVRGWDGAAAAVLADLKLELDKVYNKFKLQCHHFVLITNVPLTGGHRIGTRDKASKIALEWKTRIPQIEVWDASDLSRMLDDNADVRTAYSELILPGDVLYAIYTDIQDTSQRRDNIFRGYLKYILDHESKARAEEAGDDETLPLSEVYIDQSLRLHRQSVPEVYRELVASWSGDSQDDDFAYLVPDDLDWVNSSFLLLWGAQEKTMLLAGPGYGKSTITQFLVIYHAARILRSPLAERLAERLVLPENWKPSDLACPLRFPFRIELRRFAKWRRIQEPLTDGTGVAAYIAKQLIGGVVESHLTQEDVFAMIGTILRYSSWMGWTKYRTKRTVIRFYATARRFCIDALARM